MSRISGINPERATRYAARVLEAQREQWDAPLNNHLFSVILFLVVPFYAEIDEQSRSREHCLIEVDHTRYFQTGAFRQGWIRRGIPWQPTHDGQYSNILNA